MSILIFGRESNLSRALSDAMPAAKVVSARDFLMGQPLSVPIDVPITVIINAFQPATRLGDVSEPTAYVERALLSTARLLEALDQHNVNKVVYTSSASVYGDCAGCLETCRLSAEGLHAGLKVAAESLVRAVCEARGTNFTIVRLFNMYGGSDHFSVISKVIAAARDKNELILSNNGTAIRDFIHIDDVVRSYLAVLNSRDVPIVNIASGAGVSIRNVVDALALRGIHLRVTPVRRAGEILVSTANIDQLSLLVNTGSFTQVIDFVLREVFQ